MKTHKTLLVIATVTLFVTLSVLTARKSDSAPAPVEYHFFLPVVDDMATSGMVSMLRDVATTLSQIMSVKIVLDLRQYSRAEMPFSFVENAFKSGKSHFGLLYSEDYVKLSKKYKSAPLVIPIANLTMNNQSHQNLCVFVRRDSGITTVAGLKGKKIALTNVLGLHYYLYKQANYSGSLYNYFSDIRFILDTTLDNMIDATVNGEVDAFFLNKNSYVIAQKGPNAAKVVPLTCEKYVPNFVIVASTKTPTAVSGKVKELLLGAHKDQRFQKFKFMFTAIKGRFVPITDADLTEAKLSVELYDRYDWEADDKKFFATIKKTTRK